jgi:hypothetical protein
MIKANFLEELWCDVSIPLKDLKEFLQINKVFRNLKKINAQPEITYE